MIIIANENQSEHLFLRVLAITISNWKHFYNAYTDCSKRFTIKNEYIE